MIILRKHQKEYSVLGNFAMNVKNMALKGAVKGTNFVNGKINSLNNMALNPGKAVNKKVENTIRRPTSETIKSLETVNDFTGVIPSIPGVSISSLGNKLENKMMKKGTRVGLAIKANKYKKSNFAKNLESGINAVYNSGRAMMGLPMI